VEVIMHKVAILGAVLLACAAAETDARACGFYTASVEQAPKKAPKAKPAAPLAPIDLISAAERHLNEERAAEAGAEVVQAFPKIRTTSVGASPVETRAAHILALALVRSGGALSGVTGFANDAERTINLEWSVAVLRLASGARGDDPGARGDLGEALAALPKYNAEAATLLGELADRDLLGSAHAYASLARLRAGQGDTAQSRTALDRCTHMTKAPSAVCVAPDGRLAVHG
jgi:hypothetical protein